MSEFSATTVLMVRRHGKTCMVSDGQVTFNDTVIKTSASKVKRAGKGRVLIGFAGGAADGLSHSEPVGLWRKDFVWHPNCRVCC
jgi:ATP-dependent HslUV protease subunit HslV